MFLREHSWQIERFLEVSGGPGNVKRISQGVNLHAPFRDFAILQALCFVVSLAERRSASRWITSYYMNRP